MIRISRNNSNKATAGNYIFSKKVGKCILEHDFDVLLGSIPLMQANLSNHIYPSNSCDVRLIIDNQYYNCKLLYANPKNRNEPCLQFRYDSNPELLRKLKQIFQYSFNKIIDKKISIKGNYVDCHDTLFRNNLIEEFSIYSTDKKDVFLLKYSNVYNKLAA